VDFVYGVGYTKKFVWTCSGFLSMLLDTQRNLVQAVGYTVDFYVHSVYTLWIELKLLDT
jgi:hypothetical protein